MSVRCGTPYLTRLLAHLLYGAIRFWVPQVKSDVAGLLQNAEAALRDMGAPMSSSEDASAAGAPSLCLKLLSRFASNFSDMIDGRVHGADADDLLTAQMFGGARIQEVIRSRFYCATAEWLAAFQRNDPAILPDEEVGG